MKLQLQLLALMTALVGFSSAAPLPVTEVDEHGQVIGGVVKAGVILGSQAIDTVDTALTEGTNTVNAALTDGTNTVYTTVTDGTDAVNDTVDDVLHTADNAVDRVTGH